MARLGFSLLVAVTVGGGALTGALVGEKAPGNGGATGFLARYTQILEKTQELAPLEVPASELVYGSVDGMLETLDPHSNFLRPEAFAAMRERQQGSFYGIGVLIGIRGGKVTILTPIEGTPAYRLGLRAGDIIEAVDGQSTEDMDLDEVARRLRGPEGTTVRVTIIRPGLPEPLEFQVTRARVPTDSVRYAFLLNERTAYIRIGEFTRTTGHEVANALKNLTNQGATRLILDLREEMKRDPAVFVMGEDVGLYGGAYGATRGLFDEFGPERVRDTPISEATIAGAAVGAAMTGLRPVAEIMYVDFTPLAMDQIANQGAKNRYMFGGKTRVPMVIRTEGGTGRCIAAHHSQSLEALWVHFPGIYVVMPSTPYDAKGLLKASIRDDNPVMFIEHKMLYGVTGPVPEEEYIIPLGVADVKREGKDVTVVTYSRMVYRALEAADKLAEEGISVEVIDLRTLKPLDLETIVASVRKTGRLVGVTEAYRTGSFLGEIFALVNEEAFDYLDAPMVRVAAEDVPVPMSETLEAAAVPSTQSVIEGIRKALRGR